MKNKITEIDNSVTKITGEELLLEFEGYQGKILYCTEVGEQFYSKDGIGDYVIVTDKTDHPLISLDDGVMWRPDIQGCLFVIVKFPIQIN